MSKKETIYLKGYSTRKVLTFFGAILLGFGVAYLAKMTVPYVQENPVAMFVIFPIISLPLGYCAIRHLPKCQVCGKRTERADTPEGSPYDNLLCPSCGQRYKIDSTNRS